MRCSHISVAHQNTKPNESLLLYHNIIIILLSPFTRANTLRVYSFILLFFLLVFVAWVKINEMWFDLMWMDGSKHFFFERIDDDDTYLLGGGRWTRNRSGRLWMKRENYEWNWSMEGQYYRRIHEIGILNTMNWSGFFTVGRMAHV